MPAVLIEGLSIEALHQEQTAEDSIASRFEILRQLSNNPNASKNMCPLHQLPKSCPIECITEEQEDALLEGLLHTSQSPHPCCLLGVTSVITFLAAAAQKPSRMQRVFHCAAELLPILIADSLHESKHVVDEDALPQAAATCILYKLIAKHASLDSSSLEAMIGSLLALCDAILPAYFDHDNVIRQREEARDAQAVGRILVSIFDVLTDFEKERHLAKMSPTAETVDLAIPVVLIAAVTLASFPNHIVPLGQILTVYTNCLTNVDESVGRMLTPQKLEQWLSIWKECCSRVLEETKGKATSTKAEYLARGTRPIAGIFDHLTVSVTSWLKLKYPDHLDTSSHLFKCLLGSQHLWERIRGYESHLLGLYATDQADVMQAIVTTLQWCDMGLIRGIAAARAWLTGTFVGIAVLRGEAVKLDVAMASLTKWAEEPNPCIGGDSRQALLAAGSLVCSVLTCTVFHLEVHEGDVVPTFLCSAAHCAALMLRSAAADLRGCNGVAIEIAEVLFKILNGFPSTKDTLVEVIGDAGIVEVLWTLFLDLKVDGSCPETEGLWSSICKVLFLLGEMMPCLLARQLTIGDETAFEWHDVPTVVKTVLGSSQHVTSASEHMIVKLIRRVFEIKQNCRCWRNYDSASGPCSRTVLLGNTWYVRSRKAKRPNEQALLGAPPDSPGPSTSTSTIPTASDGAQASESARVAKAEAAMSSLLLEEAALESAAKSKAARMARKRASKAAAAKRKSSASSPASTVSACSGGASSKAHSRKTSLTTAAAGDADVADDELVSGRPAGQPECTSLADWMLCPMTKELFRDPVVCTDGFSYERAAAVTWLENNDTSFVTGDRLTSQHVVPNLALRSRLRDMQPTPIESADRGK